AGGRAGRTLRRGRHWGRRHAGRAPARPAPAARRRRGGTAHPLRGRMMKTLRSLAAALAASLALAGCQHGAASTDSPQEAFFANLPSLCGQKFAGELEVDEPPAPDNDAYADNAMVMHVRDCTADEVRIPFQVGADH